MTYSKEIGQLSFATLPFLFSRELRDLHGVVVRMCVRFLSVCMYLDKSLAFTDKASRAFNTTPLSLAHKRKRERRKKSELGRGKRERKSNTQAVTGFVRLFLCCVY